MSFIVVAALLTAQFTDFLHAAHRFLPEVRWKPHSMLTGDFACRTHQDVALLGTTDEEIVVAIFLDGAAREPRVLRYSAEARNAATATLSIQPPGVDDPDAPPGSGRCTGLTLDDGEIDGAHIYWDSAAQDFNDWVR